MTLTHFCYENILPQLFAPECPSNAVAIEFTAKLIDLTLKTHNQYRDQIANGKLKRYEQAARMATLVSFIYLLLV